MDFARRSYKAVIAGVSIIAGVLVALGTDPNVSGVLPQTVTGWILSAGAVLGGTVLTWLKANEPTVTEATKLLEDARARAGV
jgi:hypothetical protein